MSDQRSWGTGKVSIELSMDGREQTENPLLWRARPSHNHSMASESPNRRGRGGVPVAGPLPRTLTFSSLAVPFVMGQQVYEEQIIGGAAEVLGKNWNVRRVTVRTLRANDRGSHRLPMRLMTSGSETSRRAAAKLLYGGSEIVHRLDLRLPPFAGPEIITIHDVIPWRFVDEAKAPPTGMSEARRAAAVVCPSAFSASEVKNLLGVKEPVVIPNGVDSSFFAAKAFSERELGALGLRPPFVMHIGGSSRRKNLDSLASAWRDVIASIPDARLALVGPAHPTRSRLFAAIDGTVLLGRLPDPIVPRLMASASAVVVPSIYEGYGLPALEAMAAGTPVVASNCSSLPEVCGDAALLVAPDRGGLAEGMLAVIRGGGHISELVSRGRIRAKRFTWERCLAEHADVWRSISA